MVHVHSSREYGELGEARGELGAVLVFLPGMIEIQVAVAATRVALRGKKNFSS